MLNYCKLIVAGRLTRDPEVRTTASGKEVANATVAVNHGRGDKEEVCFLDITLWDKQAASFAEFFKKGMPVFVEGRLRQENWEKDGQKRSKISMVVETWRFVEAKKDGEPAKEAPARKQRPETKGEDYGEIPFAWLIALPFIGMMF